MKEAESCNYKINGEVMSFVSKEDFAKQLNFMVNQSKEPLTVEPLDSDGMYYDHMEEIADRGHEILSYAKGFIAMALAIQETGDFQSYAPYDILSCATRCSELIQEIQQIAEAAGRVYEEQAKRRASELMEKLYAYKVTNQEASQEGQPA